MSEEALQVAPLLLTGDSSELLLDRVALDAASVAILDDFHDFHIQHSADCPMHDPEWLRGYFEGQTANLSFYALYRGSRLCGLAPFLLRPWPIEWRLGEWPLAEFPLQRLKMLGGGIDFPEDPDAYDLLFRELDRGGAGFDTLYLEEVPVESFLWKYLQQSQIVRELFVRYQPEAPMPRPVLRVEGTFEQYMAKFNSKHRNTLNRKIKKLKGGALGDMRLSRYESPADVTPFLEQAIAVSRKTYQWSRYGRGLSATDLIRKRLSFAARHGWMRSYLLVAGGQARAFLMGYQYNGRFLLDEIGFDPELASYSVGTVLQMLAVEDLFVYNRPHIFDLQDYGGYKEVLATECFLQGKLFLFRRGAYAQFLKSGHRSMAAVNRVASSLLAHLNLKSGLKQRLRGWKRAVR